jgi:hypothetical protein
MKTMPSVSIIFFVTSAYHRFSIFSSLDCPADGEVECCSTAIMVLYVVRNRYQDIRLGINILDDTVTSTQALTRRHDVVKVVKAWMDDLVEAGSRTFTILSARADQGSRASPAHEWTVTTWRPWEITPLHCQQNHPSQSFDLTGRF